MAQNRLVQEMIAQAAILVVTLSACLAGLKWGLEGVSWSVLGSQVFATTYLYILAYRTIPTRLTDLIRAITPGLKLNSMLFLVLTLTDYLTGDLRTTGPALYLLLMVIPGSLVYLAAFLLLPIPALGSEVDRWHRKINEGLRLIQKAGT